MANYIEALAGFIKKGGEMAEYLQKNKFFPQLLVSMVRTGEESGELVKMINDTSKYYEVAVKNGLDKFIVLIEPILIIFAACIVIVVLLAFYLPMFKMFQAIR
jgi:type II secretory pathway component PulF